MPTEVLAPMSLAAAIMRGVKGSGARAYGEGESENMGSTYIGCMACHDIYYVGLNFIDHSSTSVREKALEGIILHDWDRLNNLI